MFSAPVGPQLLDYIDDQVRFYQGLPESIAALMNIRLYIADYGWDIEARLRDAGMEHIIKAGKKEIIDQLRESRLCILTFNTTTFLETLAANYPTLMFWNPKHWELRPSAQPYFDELRRVGILHDTPELAAAKMAEIASDTQSWWNERDIQDVKNEICDKYANVHHNWLKTWKQELQML